MRTKTSYAGIPPPEHRTADIPVFINASNKRLATTEGILYTGEGQPDIGILPPKPQAMETAIFATAICMLLLGRPRLRYTLPADGSYMSHDRTRMINGIFLVLIILRHMRQNGYDPYGVDLWFRDYIDYPLVQFIVATFFFYSGYGIMSSIRKKGVAYVHDLLSKRFLRLYLNFAVAAIISCAVMATFYMEPADAAKRFALSMVGMGGWWFIVMTLALYLLTWASFRLCGTGRPWRAIALLSVLTADPLPGAIPIQAPVVAGHGTLLCRGCGVLHATAAH